MDKKYKSEKAVWKPWVVHASNLMDEFLEADVRRTEWAETIAVKFILGLWVFTWIFLAVIWLL